MRSKVSMVMPCYNKVQYIGNMLNSILAQEWNEIELILVNDGSTDGTREVIAEYEPKLLERGYELIIVDQQNAGVCAAAKAGFMRVTGDFICAVDSDDELDSKYVSTMAGWLEEHREYDIAACEGINYVVVGEYKNFQPFNPVKIVDGDPFLLERWLLADYRAEPWRYMVRAEYFYKCRIVETYHTLTKGSHEPSYIVPLFANGGRVKYFALPLYHFNVTGESHSRHKHVWQVRKHFDDYVALCKEAIEALPEHIADAARKRSLINTATVACNYRRLEGAIYLNRAVYPVSNKQILSVLTDHNIAILSQELVNTVNSVFLFRPPIIWERVAGSEAVFYEMVKNCIAPPAYRIVGCGVMGRNGRAHLPLLKGSPLEPNELWDEAGDGVTAKKPDYTSLTSQDIAIVFPLADGKAGISICERLKKTGCAIIAQELAVAEGQYWKFPELMKIGRPDV